MLAYHRIIESQNGWVGGDCRAHPVPTSCHGLVASHQLRLPRAPYNPTLSTSGDGAPTASLGSTAPVPDLWVKNLFFTSNLHLPSVRMKPFPIVLSLSDCVKSWFPLLLLSSPQVLWGRSEVSLQPSLPQAKQAQLPQPVFTGDVLQPSEHLRGPPLDPLQQPCILLVLELGTVFIREPSAPIPGTFLVVRKMDTELEIARAES